MFGSLLYGVLRWPSRVRQDTGGQSRVSSHLTPADSTHSCELKQRTSPSHLRSCRVVRRRGSYLLCATRISSQSFTDRATPADTYSVRRRRRPDPSRCSRRTDSSHKRQRRHPSRHTNADTDTPSPLPNSIFEMANPALAASRSKTPRANARESDMQMFGGHKRRGRLLIHMPSDERTPGRQDPQGEPDSAGSKHHHICAIPC